MSTNNITRFELLNSSHRINWEISKDKTESINFPSTVVSGKFLTDINGKESDWCFHVYPKGCKNPTEKEKNKVIVSLVRESKADINKVTCGLSIKTQDGYWLQDSVKKIISRVSYEEGNYFRYTDDEGKECEGWRYILCSMEEFEKYFVDNKITIVALFEINVEVDEYRNRMQVSDEFVDNVRSISSQENLTDFTIISCGKHFPCHRVLLAVRSEYFEALFRNEPTKTEIEVEEGPELVEAMLEFMSKGRIPEDIDDKAMDLILVADMYRLDLLAKACGASLLNNLLPDNAVETLITIDKVNYVSKLEHHQKVIVFIKKEADQVVKSKDWKRFVQNYPDLITEIIVFKCCKEYGSYLCCKFIN